MNEVMIQIRYAVGFISLFFLSAFVVYVLMKAGTFGVLMGHKRFLEYQIRKEDEEHGKS
jgi:hypothetical protein